MSDTDRPAPEEDPIDGLFLSHKDSVTLVLRGVSGHPQIIPLRMLLKRLLRSAGMKCIKTLPGDATLGVERPAGRGDR
jgi:hypothetical protein